MSFSQREQAALDAIENGLARSSPELASMLTIFSRLTQGEELPVRERVWPAGGDLGTGAAAAWRIGRGPIRHHLSREGWRWLWLVAVVALLALALSFGHGTGKKPCMASGFASWRRYLRLAI